MREKLCLASGWDAKCVDVCALRGLKAAVLTRLPEVKVPFAEWVCISTRCTAFSHFIHVAKWLLNFDALGIATWVFDPHGGYQFLR